MSFGSGATQEGITNYSCFYNRLCKGDFFDLLCVKQISSRVLSIFFFVMGQPTCSNEKNTLIFVE